MKPIPFKQMNCEFATNQKEYYPLPAHKSMSIPTIITSCWSMSFKERVKNLFCGKIYVKSLTFDTPLQPSQLSTKFEYDE